MKQFEVTQKTINGNRFYIRPFPAFKSAFISGEVFAFLSPLASSLIPVAVGALNSDETSVYDMDISSAIPALASGLGGVNGEKVEDLLKKLLIQYKTISVETEGETEPQLLTEDIANEVFCGDVQDMFILAFEVIKVNFPGIFKKLGDQYGKVIDGLLKKKQTSEHTESSTIASSTS